MRIGPIELEAPTALAPMVGVTDRVFRSLVKGLGGCGYLTTEMLSAAVLVRGGGGPRDFLAFTDEERPIGAQLMGANPEVMAEAARRVEDLGFDFVDVNMGCPSRRIVAQGGGSALLRDLPAAGRVVEAMVRAVSVPVTVKLRAGFTPELLNAPAAARVAEASGASLVTLHARVRSDRYRHAIRTEVLTRTRESVSIPVVGNGDVDSVAEARALTEATGCAGVMVGRAAVSRPWLLSEIAAGRMLDRSPEEVKGWILGHFERLEQEYSGAVLVGRLRTFSGKYTKSLMKGAAFRQRINDMLEPREFREAVEEYFAKERREA